MPGSAILENLGNLHVKAKHQTESALDFLLRGKVKEGNVVKTVGLTYLERFHLRSVRVAAKQFALPQPRWRYYFVLLNKARCSASALEKFDAVIEKIKDRQHMACSQNLDDFLASDDEEPATIKEKQDSVWLNRIARKSQERHSKFIHKHKLKKVDELWGNTWRIGEKKKT